MRNFILALSLVALPYLVHCEAITVEQAAKVARNFYFQQANISSVIGLNDISIASIRSKGGQTAAYYICDMSPKGFVVVSAVDNVIPVLAY
ncbi:MAG: Spi family protease inhibitor [Bacteroidota bacterium]